MFSLKQKCDNYLTVDKDIGGSYIFIKKKYDNYITVDKDI